VYDNDSQILESVRAGNSRAYAALVDRHKAKAMTLAVRILGKREEAEEVVQDAFLKAYRNLDDFRGDAKFSTWLYRILYNLCMTRVTRRKEAMASIDAGDGNSLDVLEDEEEVSAIDKMAKEELKGLVHSHIGLLPEKLRTAILLFYIQEMSYEEMSFAMAMPLGSVKTYLHRGRNLLRKRLADHLKREGSLT